MLGKYSSVYNFLKSLIPSWHNHFRLSCLLVDFKVNQRYKKAGYASIMLDDYLVMISLGVDQHNTENSLVYVQLIYKYSKLA